MTHTFEEREPEETLASWAAQIVDLRRRSRALAELADQYVTLLREALGDDFEGRIGNHKVLVRREGQWNADLALTVLTPDEITACTVQTLDRKAVEALVSPERYAQCQAPNKNPTVRIK